MNTKPTWVKYATAAMVYVLFIMLIAIGFILIMMKTSHSNDNTNVIKTEATVVDKHEKTNRIYNGKTYITPYSYYLNTHIAGREEDQKIQVPQSSYNQINKNDIIMIDITVDKNNKIVKVDLSE